MKRVQYWDTLKGVLIILIVMRHCDCVYEAMVPGLEALIMPLFFAISGVFYKSNESYINFLVSRINRLIVPFTFFYLAAYALFYFMKYFMPGLLITEAQGIGDVFTQKMLFNTPIWYLIAIFWSLNFYYFLERLITLFKINKSIIDVFKLISICLMGILGAKLGQNFIFLPAYMDVALTAMPFFYFGVLLKDSKIITPNRFDRYNLVWAALCYAGALLISLNFEFRFVMNNNILDNFIIYPLSFLSILSIIFVAKSVGNIPLLSYIGRKTMIILCLHQMVYRPLQVLLARQPLEFLQSPYVVALLTILICLATLPIFSKYFPWAIGEKSLISLKRK